MSGSALVIGGGLAGSVAALALAEGGQSVRLLSGGPGATALCSGSLDVAAASPGIPHLPWRDPLRGRALAAEGRLALVLSGAAAHPYGRLTRGDAEALQAAARDAVERLRAWLAPTALALEGDLAKNLWLPTAQGTLRITDHAFSGAAEADLSRARRVWVADVPGLEGWEAAPCARNLTHELDALGLGPMPVESVALRAPLGPPGKAACSPARMAAWLDTAEGEAALVAALDGIGGEDEVVLLPQVVGLARTRERLAALETGGRRVGEALAFPPHAMAGFRLMRALEAALDAAGVQRLQGRAAKVRAEGEGYRVEASREAPFPGPAYALEASSLVVATGRFTGGGLVAAREGVREPLMGLPVMDGEGRRVDGIPAARSVRKGYGNDQPLYGAGVTVDASLRPRGAPGRGLFAAGDWIGGFDPARERTGLGTALLTGLAAGLGALAFEEGRAA